MKDMSCISRFRGKTARLLLADRAQQKLSKAGLRSDRAYQHLSSHQLFLSVKLIHINVTTQVCYILSVKQVPCDSNTCLLAAPCLSAREVCPNASSLSYGLLLTNAVFYPNDLSFWYWDPVKH